MNAANLQSFPQAPRNVLASLPTLLEFNEASLEQFARIRELALFAARDFRHMVTISNEARDTFVNGIANAIATECFDAVQAADGYASDESTLGVIDATTAVWRAARASLPIFELFTITADLDVAELASHAREVLGRALDAEVIHLL